MPKLGLTMTEGLLAEWSLGPGDRFAAEQTVFVVESEKAANEIAAPGAGTLLEIVVAVSETVPVGAVVGWWDDGVLPATSAGPAVRRPMTPLARRRAEHEGVDLAAVQGSGPGGRVVARDVVSPSPGRAAVALPQPVGKAPARVEPSHAMATMARRMTAAKQETPHFYLALDIDCAALLARRARLNAEGVSPRLTLTHFLIGALGRALTELPLANRVWSEGAPLQLEASDVGVVAHGERGLFVPIVRNAGALSLRQIAAQSQVLVGRARDGRLSGVEMTGGAVSVSNAGMFNVRYLTPIINPGQAMILGVGSIQPVFRPDASGQPELRQEMGLVLACDHRILDGVAALRFFHRVVAGLQQTDSDDPPR